MKLQIEFWYESNPFFGWVRTLDDLKEAIGYQLEENNGILDVDEFLDKSMQNITGSNDFGTRREHFGEKSLRAFLSEQNFDFNLLN